MSSFSSTAISATTAPVQPSQQSYFGVVSEGVAVPSFGFTPAFGSQPVQLAAMSTQQGSIQPGSFSLAPANSNPFVFGTQHSAVSTTAVFSLGKRSNVDAASGDGNKRHAAGSCIFVDYCE